MKHRNNKTDAKNLRELMEAIVAIDSVEDCRRFFIDLCTPAELQSLSDRWRVAQLLDRGVPYRQIYEQTGVSTATVTRVARALAHGKDGYRRVLDQAVNQAAERAYKPSPKATPKTNDESSQARAVERSKPSKRARR